MKLKKPQKKKQSLVSKLASKKLRKGPEDIIGVPDDVGRGSKRSAAGKKAKNKGSRFERQVRDQMSEWWGAPFYRTPGSGGSVLATDFNMAGDLCTPDQTFPFHVECKNQEVFGKFFTFFSSEKAALWKWVEQAENDAKGNDVPLVIFTKNHMPVFVMMNVEFYEILKLMSTSYVQNNPFRGLKHSLELRIKNYVILFLDTLTLYPKEFVIDTARLYPGCL